MRGVIHVEKRLNLDTGACGCGTVRYRFSHAAALPHGLAAGAVAVRASDTWSGCWDSAASLVMLGCAAQSLPFRLTGCAFPLEDLQVFLGGVYSTVSGHHISRRRVHARLGAVSMSYSTPNESQLNAAIMSFSGPPACLAWCPWRSPLARALPRRRGTPRPRPCPWPPAGRPAAGRPPVPEWRRPRCAQ
jgi:hypothetical protein